MSYKLFLKAGCLLAASLPLWLGSPAEAANPVTFQIDMTSQPTATDVFVRGSFNGYSTANQLTNNGSGVYTGTVDIADSPGTIESCKFFYQPGDNWEGDPNRQFALAGGPQTLPLTGWNEKYPAPANNVTFQVNMNAQVALGLYTPGDSMTVAGDFTGWGNGVDLTNNPSLSGSASNIYSGVLPVTGFPGATGTYKFRANGGWESPTSTSGNNRTFQLAGGDQILPLVFYSDDALSDLMATATLVTFNVSMTNAVATDSTVFNPATDTVFLNGEFLGWKSWNATDLAPYQMTNNPVGSSNYSLALPFAKGSRLAIVYKYSINGPDNEAAQNANHIRYIRSTGTYNMPLDTFGNQLIEQSFGNLTAGPASSGHTVISWLGRPGVQLQTRSSLSSGTWQNHPQTDGLMSTNWPVTGGSLFFRLIKPGS